MFWTQAQSHGRSATSVRRLYEVALWVYYYNFVGRPFFFKIGLKKEAKGRPFFWSFNSYVLKNINFQVFLTAHGFLG